MEVVKPSLEEKFIESFGIEWYETMEEYLHSSTFLTIGATIAKIRKGREVFPAPNKVFRIFKEVPLSQVRVVMLGLDPYNTPKTACGHAFCNCEAYKVSPSLKIIHQEIEDEYPELVDRFIMPAGGIDKWDLKYLVRQGVFLWNTALTVERDIPESHLELWRPFTIQVIKELNKIPFLVWLLLGKKAQGYEQLISSKHAIVTAVHPAAEAYRPGAGFLHSGCFRQVNYHLNRMGKREIEW